MRTLVTAETLLAPASALAGGYFIPNENARELALAEATVASQDGPGAVILNPAALAGPTGLAISASGEVLINRTDWSDPSLGSASVVPKPSLPPAVAVSYGDTLANGMAWGAGIGFDVPGGGSLVWPNGWPGQEFAQSVDQRLYAITAGVGFRPLPELRVGATYMRYQITEEVHQGVNYLDHIGDAGLGLAGGGNAFGLGVEYRPHGVPLSVGATYRHSADVNLEGDVHFEAVPAAFTTILHDQGVTESVTIPNIVNIGAAYMVKPGLTVMAAYTFERWTVYKSDTFVGSDGFTVSVPRDYNNAHVLRLGGEWQQVPFHEPLTLRAGILRSISQQPSETLSPTLSDGDSWALSIGAGYRVLKDLQVDLGYQHAFFDKVTASGMDTLPGSYDTRVDIVSLGATWRTDLGLKH